MIHEQSGKNVSCRLITDFSEECFRLTRELLTHLEDLGDDAHKSLWQLLSLVSKTSFNSMLFQQLSNKISVLCLKGDWRSKTDGRFPVITYFISSNKWYIRIKLSSSTPVSHIQYICCSIPENGPKINLYHQDLYIVLFIEVFLVCDLRQELLIHIWKWYREISKYVTWWNSKDIANTNFPCQYLIIFVSVKR